MSNMAAQVERAEQASVDTVLTLPEGMGSLTVADSCRAAALTFLNGSSRWSKADLAMWLLGPYGQLTQYVSPSSNQRMSRRPGPVPMLRDIDARMVDRMMRNAYEEVMSALEHMSDPEQGASFTFTMIAARFVAPCLDQNGVAGWVPTTGARRLADRLLSLIAADYLSRPLDYETELAICASCKTVEFDGVSRARGICPQHGSGVFTPGQPPSLPYFPEGA